MCLLLEELLGLRFISTTIKYTFIKITVFFVHGNQITQLHLHYLIVPTNQTSPRQLRDSVVTDVLDAKEHFLHFILSK